MINSLVKGGRLRVWRGYAAAAVVLALTAMPGAIRAQEAAGDGLSQPGGAARSSQGSGQKKPWPFSETADDTEGRRAWPFSSPSDEGPFSPPDDGASSSSSSDEVSSSEPEPTGQAASGRPVSLSPPDRGGPPLEQQGNAPVPGEADTQDSGGNVPGVLFPSGPTLSPAERPEAVGVRTLAPRPGNKESGIEIGTLGSVDESSAGLLRENEGGFGVDMWRGTRRLSVEQYLPQLPVMTASPVMRDLARRLLLSAAHPPQGATEGGSLLGLRLERLLAMGEAQAVRDLAEQAGAAMRDPAVALIYAQAALAGGDTRAACQALSTLPVGGDPSRDAAAAFNLRLSALCQILGGQKAAANLTADLAREQGLDDPLFYSLVAEATTGLKLKAPAPGQLEGLNVALYAAAGRPLPDNAAEIAVRALLPRLADDTMLAPETRLRAAERAALAGLLPGSRLSEIYLGMVFAMDEFAGLKLDRLPAKPELRHALLHQAVLAETDPAARAKLLSLAFTVAESDGFYRQMVEVSQPALAVLSPAASFAGFVPEAVRAFAILGDQRRAERWFSVLATAETGPSKRTARELGAILRLMGTGRLPDGEAAAADIVADFQGGSVQMKQFAAFEALLLDALGVVMPPRVWDVMLDANDMPPGDTPEPVMMRDLGAAVKNMRRGETIMMTLVALGERGPGAMHPNALSAIASGLRVTGFTEEARQLALEVLMARAAWAVGAARISAEGSRG